jgi:hypothetical protein
MGTIEHQGKASSTGGSRRRCAQPAQTDHPETRKERTAIVGWIINTVRDRLADGILWPVMHQHRLGRSAPGPAGILEVTDQLLFF